MTEKSYFWDGASLGDAVYAPYHLSNADYESPLVDVFLRMVLNGDENRGVLSGWANELEVTGVATPVSVNTGGAIVYGMPYENTAAVSVAVTTPTTDTRYDRIVLRRSWTAQTVRITKITGVEGGSAPAMTQSPSPSGTGIYDVPLALLEVTTGGVITVTDEREYCQFSTIMGDLVSANLQDDSVDFPDRATRTKRLFVGGGDLQPALSAGRFMYALSAATSILMTGTSAWGGAADEKGWELTGSQYEGAYATVWLPLADYATGDVQTYIWWVNNSAVAADFYMYAAVQMYDPVLGFSTYYVTPDGTHVTNVGAVSDVFRTQAVTIPGQYVDGVHGYGNYNILHYMAYWNNAAGSEDISVLGIEFVYTGYT